MVEKKQVPSKLEGRKKRLLLELEEQKMTIVKAQERIVSIEEELKQIEDTMSMKLLNINNISAAELARILKYKDKINKMIIGEESDETKD